MLTHLKTYLTLLAFGMFSSIHAQFDNDFQAGLYNIALGGVLGGVGAIINKTPQQTTGQALWKGAKEGALGGYLMFEGKRMVRRFSRSGDYAYLWPAKILHSAGTAMVENAAANQAFGSQWHLNIGFNRLEYHPFAKEKKFKYRIMPFSLGGTIIASQNGRLNLNKSLQSGTLIFEGSGSFEHLIDDNIDFEPDGLAIYNVILTKENPRHFSKNDVIAHEMIHVFQYEELSAVNAFLNKPYAQWNNHKLVAGYHKWFYTDMNALVDAGIYNLFRSYETNFYEREAEYYR